MCVGVRLRILCALVAGVVIAGPASAQLPATSATTFTNSTPNAVPATGTLGVAATYPSSITVAGLTGTVYHVSVSLALSHTFPGDLDILLVGPGGAVILMSDVGSSFSTPLSNTTITFDDCSPRTLRSTVATGTFLSGRYRPQNDNQGDLTLTAPAPVGPYGNVLADFNWSTGNGTWSLYAVDDVSGDIGTIHSWSITLYSTATTPGLFGPLSPISCSKPDYDGDGRADVAIFRPADGSWFISKSGGSGSLLQASWGAPASTGLGDTDVPADYDGDGITDLAIYRQATGDWFIRQSSSLTPLQISFGAPSGSGLGDTPVPADYDGDGLADAAVYRATTGEWFLRTSAGFGPVPISWGFPPAGDNPAR